MLLDIDEEVDVHDGEEDEGDCLKDQANKEDLLEGGDHVSGRVEEWY